MFDKLADVQHKIAEALPPGVVNLVAGLSSRTGGIRLDLLGSSHGLWAPGIVFIDRQDPAIYKWHGAGGAW